jgi:succinate dehydrogenase/fumarate reductase flavoprotein subunit
MPRHQIAESTRTNARQNGPLSSAGAIKHVSLERVNAMRSLTRRRFVRRSVTGVAAGLLAGTGAHSALPSDGSSPWLPNKWDREADIVIIGSGYAGCNAAVAGHDAGSKVLILEKAPEQFAGGNSSVSGGGMSIPSNLEDAKKYYRALGFGTVPDDLVSDMAEAMIQVPEQLKKIGIEVAPIRMSFGPPAAKPAPAMRARVPSGLSLLPGAGNNRIYAIVPPNGYPRMGTGKELYLAHKACLRDRKIEILYETPAKELIQNPVDKSIQGVAAELKGKKIFVKAKKAVVLACGGYEANYEMQVYFNFPGIKIYPWGTPYNTGDGIKMVSEVGAPLWHTCNLEWDGPCVKVPSEKHGVSIMAGICTNAGVPGNYVLVNKYGKRFMNDTKSLTHIKESLELTYFDHEKVEYPNLPFYIIFDETYRMKQPLVPKNTFQWAHVHKVVEWSSDNSAEIEKGWVLKATTLKELAVKAGIDPAGLEATVSKYNEFCQAGKDADFKRRPENLFPVATPPFYAAELALTVTNTQGGPKHNGKSQTLNKDNKPIPRLYSAGEFGSFFGFLYPGGSNIPEAIAFGRIAGENAASEKPWV